MADPINPVSGGGKGLGASAPEASANEDASAGWGNPKKKRIGGFPLAGVPGMFTPVRLNAVLPGLFGRSITVDANIQTGVEQGAAATRRFGSAPDAMGDIVPVAGKDGKALQQQPEKALSYEPVYDLRNMVFAPGTPDAGNFNWRQRRRKRSEGRLPRRDEEKHELDDSES
jgi:hypothetical protein